MRNWNVTLIIEQLARQKLAAPPKKDLLKWAMIAFHAFPGWPKIHRRSPNAWFGSRLVVPLHVRGYTNGNGNAGVEDAFWCWAYTAKGFRWNKLKPIRLRKIRVLGCWKCTRTLVCSSLAPWNTWLKSSTEWERGEQESFGFVWGIACYLDSWRRERKGHE